MPRLYRSPNEPLHWLLWSEEIGWARFPAKLNGWDERRSLRAVSPEHLHAVPLHLAFNTGLLESLNPAARRRAA